MARQKIFRSGSCAEVLKRFLTAGGSVPSWSLRRTLLTVLLGLTLALWAGGAAIVYVEARRESQELFDPSLTETGHLLLSLVEKDVREHGLTGPIDLPLRGQRNPHQCPLFTGAATCAWPIRGRASRKTCMSACSNASCARAAHSIPAAG